MKSGRASSLRAHLRGNAVAYVALFFALGFGSAWAATSLESNSVRSRHIVNKQVRTGDLRDEAVTDRKLAPDAGGSELGVVAEATAGPFDTTAADTFPTFTGDTSWTQLPGATYIIVGERKADYPATGACDELYWEIQGGATPPVPIEAWAYIEYTAANQEDLVQPIPSWGYQGTPQESTADPVPVFYSSDGPIEREITLLIRHEGCDANSKYHIDYIKLRVIRIA